MDITDLDTDLTYLYKIANELQTPIKYIVLKLTDPNIDFPDIINDYLKLSLLTVVDDYYNSNADITKLYDYVTSEYIIDYRLTNLRYELAMILTNIVGADNINLINQVFEESNKFNDVDQLNIAFSSWIANYIKEKEKDTKEYNRIVEIQQQITSIAEPLLYSSFKTSWLGLQSIPNTNLSGYQLFEKAKLSQYMPFIQYKNSTGDTIYKLYQAPDTKLNYQVISDHSAKAIWNNYIYLTVSLGINVILVYYELERDRIHFEIPSTIQYETVAKIIEYTLGISAGSFKEYRIDGEFNIYNVEIIDSIFMDLVLNDNLFNNYFFLDESRTPYHLKKRVNYHVRSSATGHELGENRYNLATLSFNLKQYYSVLGERANIYNPLILADTLITLAEHQPYITVSVSKAISKRAVKQLQYLLPRILIIYNRLLPDLARVYKNITGIDVLPTPSVTKKIRITHPTSKIQQIKALASDLFVNEYARICQCSAQPIIISEEEVEEWKKKLVRGKERQIMRFPKDNPKWIFVCPDDERPYPGVKLNKVLSNADKYPYVPCCYKNDQMEPNSNSRYNEYYRGIPKRSIKHIGFGHKISTDKVLNIARLGDIPTEFSKLFNLSGYISGEIARYGIIYSPNSLIHCITDALYDFQAEQYAIELRRSIFNNINISLVKQELYDRSDEEIIELISNQEKTFDSEILYRILEEYFEINLFILYQDIYKHLSLEIGRYKYYPVRDFRPDRKTIVVYKHWGSETDNLQRPHYELIVEYFSSTDSVNKLFNIEVGEYLYLSLMELNRVEIWDGIKLIRPYNPPVFQSYRDYIIGQYIDDSGKVRAFVLNFADTLLTIVTPPSQPENLERFVNLPRIDYNQAIDMFNNYNITAVDVLNNSINGIWLEYQYIKLYIPVNPIEYDNVYPIGEPTPIQLAEVQTSVIAYITELYDTISLMLRLTLWLYKLSNYSPEEFLANYSMIGYGEPYYYDFSELPSELPLVNTVEQGIQYIQRFNTGYIVDNLIYFYSYKLYEGILYFLNITSKNYTNINVERIREFNYKPSNNEIYLKSVDEFRIWLKSAEVVSNLVHNKLSKDDAFISEPYVYLENNVMYLIQNVQPDIDQKVMIRRALTIGYYWLYYGRNLGYNPEYWKLELDYNGDYLTYKISNTGNLEYKSGDGILAILDYENGNMAAIMVLYEYTR